MPYFKYTIVIGRRDETEYFLHSRNKYGRKWGIEIRSFDYLTDKLLRRNFNVTPSISSEDFKQLDFGIKNDLANPFAEAFKSSVWREMAKYSMFSDSHMIARNAKALLNKRTLNNAIHDFKDKWFLRKEIDRQKLLEDAKKYNL